MENIEISTEKTILEAARKIFIRKGMEGARMQEIADEAGINKALLHYYFRSKEKLFQAIFEDAILKIVPGIMEMFRSDLPLFEKIEIFTGKYIDTFAENPFLPGFILNELSRDPQKIISLVSKAGLDPQLLIHQINREAESGNIQPVNPYHLVVNILSMCIFPFVASPMLLSIIFDRDDVAFSEFIRQRKTEVPQFIIHAIQKK